MEKLLGNMLIHQQDAEKNKFSPILETGMNWRFLKKLFGNSLSFLDFGEILMEDYWKSRDSGTPKMYFIIVLVLEVLMKNAA